MTRILRSWFAAPEFVSVIAKSAVASALLLSAVLALRAVS